MSENERGKALEAALQQIRRRYGDGAIMKFSEQAHAEVDVIPTGSLALDYALGVGGVPRGRVIEIFGPESSGKTTVCQHIIAEAQKLGGNAAFIDVEHALDPRYAARCGVNVDELLISQPDTGEQALEICEALVRSGAIDVVVIDSVAALVPRMEIEGDMGDAHVGLQARLMSQALRKLAGAISRSRCAVVFTNQLRQKIGVVFGSPETTTGGMALKFYATIRMDIRRVEAIKVGAQVVGNRTKVKIKKNKVAPPFREAEFDILYNEGISRSGDVLDMAVEHGLVVKRGAYFFLGEERLGQGRDNAKQALQENEPLMLELENQIRAKLGLPLRPTPQTQGGAQSASNPSTPASSRARSATGSEATTPSSLERGPASGASDVSTVIDPRGTTEA